MKVEPYIFFEGRAEEAIEFYKATLGAEVPVMMRFKHAPPAGEGQPTSAPDMAEKVMHAELKIGASTVLISDGMASGQPNFGGFCLTITVSDDAEAETLFAALSAGGQIRQPLQKTFFASRFGMVADKFGVGWVVLNPAAM